MLRRSFFAIVSVAVACVLAQGTSVQAGSVVGSIGVTDPNSPSANSGDNIQTATTFTVGDSLNPLQTLPPAESTGDFTSVPGGQAVGFATVNVTAQTFDLGAGSGLGEFTATTITETKFSFGNTVFVNLSMTGTYTPGSDFATHTPELATFGLTLNQTGGAGKSISDSGTLSVTGVPEPASMGMLGIGMVGFFTFRRLVKRKTDA